MESTESGPTDDLLDSVYLRGGGAQRRGNTSEDISASNLQSTQGSVHLSHVLKHTLYLHTCQIFEIAFTSFRIVLILFMRLLCHS